MLTVKELDDKKMNDQINIEIKRSLEKSKAALEKAEKELKKTEVKVHSHVSTGKGTTLIIADAKGENAPETDYDAMLEKMEKDGLIDRDKGFVVAKQNGKLVINGEPQSEKVLNRYSEYLKDKSVTIKGKKGGLTIDVND